MLDVEELFDSVNAAWITRLIKADENDIWTTVSKHYLQFHLNDNFIFKLNFCGKYKPEILDNVPCFYRDVLYAYNRAKQITDEVFCSNILDQPIWANDHVKYVCKRKGILLYYTNWITMGIVKIRNLRFNRSG